MINEGRAPAAKRAVRVVTLLRIRSGLRDVCDPPRLGPPRREQDEDALLAGRGRRCSGGEWDG